MPATVNSNGKLWRDELLRAAHGTLLEHGEMICGARVDRAMCKLKLVSTAVIATLSNGEWTKRVVLKRFPATVRHFSSAALFYDTHELIRDRHVALRDALPAFILYDDSRGIIVSQFLLGDCLQDELIALIKRGEANNGAALIGRAASLLADFHLVDANSVGLTGGRDADSWKESFQSIWNNSALLGALQRRDRNARRVLDLIGAKLPDERADLTFPDFQPKNLLLCPNDKLRAIDVSYSSGYGAMDVGHFLVAIDRLAFRYPVGFGFSGASHWKREFLQKYAESRPESRISEVAFFYLRDLAKSCNSHSRKWPGLRWYIRRGYSRNVEAVLSNIRRDGVPGLCGSPETLVAE